MAPKLEPRSTKTSSVLPALCNYYLTLLTEFLLSGWAVIFQPMVAGEFTVSIEHNGKHIQDSPFTVPIGTTPPEKTEKQQPSPLAKFHVIPTDDEGQNLFKVVSSVSEFRVLVQDPTNKILESTLIDNKDGSSFDVGFRPQAHGVYVINVLCRGKPVAGSPFKLNVAPPPFSG